MDWIGSALARRDPMPVKQIPAKPPVARSSARRVTIPFPFRRYANRRSTPRLPAFDMDRRAEPGKSRRATGRLQPDEFAVTFEIRDAPLIGRKGHWGAQTSARSFCPLPLRANL